MNLDINGKVIEIKFTIGAIEKLDKTYEVIHGGATFGMGISSSLAYLNQYNPVVIRNIIEAVQGKTKIGRSEIENWLESQDIEKLCNDLITELGKQPLTKTIVKQMEKATKNTSQK